MTKRIAYDGHTWSLIRKIECARQTLHELRGCQGREFDCAVLLWEINLANLELGSGDAVGMEGACGAEKGETAE